METGSRIPTAVILTAISVEYDAVLKHLKSVRQVTAQDGMPFRCGTFETGALQSDFISAWTVVVGKSGVGNVEAALLAKKMIDSFDPDIVLFVGVAGGLKTDIKIGDVVVASSVFYYESGKVVGSTDDPDIATTEPRIKLGKPSNRLFQQAVFQAEERNWQNRVGPEHDAAKNNAHVEPIVAGEKVLATKSGDLAEFIRQHHNKAVAVEMEGHGFLEAIYQSNTSGLVLRAISDYCDDKNDSTAEGTDKERQEKAANNVAAFAFEVLATLDVDSVLGKSALPQEKLCIHVEADLSQEEAQAMIARVQKAVGSDFRIFNIEKGSTRITIEGSPDPLTLIAAMDDGDILEEIVGSKAKIIDEIVDFEASEEIANLSESVRELYAKMNSEEAELDAVSNISIRSREPVWRKACIEIDKVAKNNHALRWFCLEVLAAVLRRVNRDEKRYSISKTLAGAIMGSISKELKKHHRSRVLAPEPSRLDLAQCQLEEITLDDGYFRNVKFNGANLRSCSFLNCDLIGIQLIGADARKADFSNANMRGSSLRGGMFVASRFRYTNLSSADLSTAVLISALLDNANLTNANLNRADLRRVRASSARLRGADLRDANIRGAVFNDADLRDIRLEGIIGLPYNFEYFPYRGPYPDKR